MISWDVPELVEEHLLERLQPGESAEVMAKMKAPFTTLLSTSPGKLVLVITNRNMRVFGVSFFRGTRKRAPQVNIMMSHSWPLATLNRVTVTIDRLIVEVGADRPAILMGPRDICQKIMEAIEKGRTAPAANAGPSIADELQKLAELSDSGALSADEWTRAKELFLGKAPDSRTAALDSLSKLHSLHKAGVLSEGEFNMKKWEVLSRKTI